MNLDENMVEGRLKKDMRFIHKKVGSDSKDRPIYQIQPNLENPGQGELKLRGEPVKLPKQFEYLVDTSPQPKAKPFIMEDKQEDPEKTERQLGQIALQLAEINNRLAVLEKKPKRQTK